MSAAKGRGVEETELEDREGIFLGGWGWSGIGEVCADGVRGNVTGRLGDGGVW